MKNIGGIAGTETKKQVDPRWLLDLPVQKVDVCQWISDYGLYIMLPIGPLQQPTKFVIDTEAHIPVLTQTEVVVLVF